MSEKRIIYFVVVANLQTNELREIPVYAYSKKEARVKAFKVLSNYLHGVGRGHEYKDFVLIGEKTDDGSANPRGCV